MPGFSKWFKTAVVFIIIAYKKTGMNGLEIIFPQCRTVCHLLLSANIDFNLYENPPLASALAK
jgi:hypothetical protein